MNTAVQQIQAILSNLTPAQRAAVNKYVDLARVNIMTLSEKDAVVLLARLEAAVGAMSNQIANGMSVYAEDLKKEAKMSGSIMDEAKLAYYDAKKAIPISKDDENYKTAVADADAAFNEYMTKAELYQMDSKRANRAEFYADLAHKISGFEIFG